MRLPAVRAGLRLLLADRLTSWLIIGRIAVDVAGHIRPGLEDGQRSAPVWPVAADRRPAAIRIDIVEVRAGQQRRRIAVVSVAKVSVAIVGTAVAVINRLAVAGRIAVPKPHLVV